jgi:geranylgeranyl pyrophosphate synthase
VATGDIYLTVRERCAIMVDKTASLFALAARVGTTCADVPALIPRYLTRFALRIGMAYQLADDLRDLKGERSPTRAARSDIKTQVFTLPLLFALRSPNDSADLRSMLHVLRDNPGDGAVLWVAKEIVRLGGARAAERLLEWWLQDAQRELSRCTPPEHARRAHESLFAFVDEMLRRRTDEEDFSTISNNPSVSPEYI